MTAQDDTPKADIFFAHATSFNARAYETFLCALDLGDRVLARDMRGHGRSPLPADPATLRGWDRYAADIIELLREQPAPPGGWTLMGHSMGAMACALAAASSDLPLARIIMVEPVILPLPVRLATRTPAGPWLGRYVNVAQRAKRRRRRFDSVAAAKQAYQARAPFDRFAEGVLDDYLADGLVPDGDGTVRLACDPDWEAATYLAQGHDIWRALRSLPPERVHVIVAPAGSTLRDTDARQMARLGMTIHTALSGGHLFPLEEPHDAAALIRKLV